MDVQGAGLFAQDAESYAQFLAERRQELLDRIAQAAARAGRDASEVTLLAVSKTVDVPQVLLAHEQGYDVFGENRPQELQRKAEALAGIPGVRIDMIGNLQRNKINKVLGVASLVHSISSQHLAEAVARRASSQGLTVRCLLEVNVSGEESKSGIDPHEAQRVAERVLELGALDLQGLMTMAPANDSASARATFCGLRELADELRVSTGLELPILSCGMSGDFEIAVEEGSTLVRLGRVVFDPSYNDGPRRATGGDFPNARGVSPEAR